MTHPLYLGSIFFYLSILITFALFLSSKVKGSDDFNVAGRSLPTIVIFGTLVATWMGTGSLFGHSEKAYTSGISISLILVAEVLGFSLLYFIAGRVRKMEQVTIQDLLEIRYNAAARVFGTIALVIAYTTIVSYQFRAAGSVINLVEPSISVNMATIIAAIFIVGFTVTAGLISVAYTDLVQGITMILGMLICVPILFFKAGGISGIVEALPTEHFNLFHEQSFLKTLGLILPALLLLLGDANMYQRFFASRSEGDAKKAVFFVIFGVLFVEAMIIIAAMIGRALEPELEVPGRVLAVMAMHHLPTLVGIIILTVMTAIVISTADSYLLSPSTAFARDIYHRFIRPNAKDREILLVSRLSVVVLGLVAFGLSKLSDQFLGVALYAYTIYGASITPSLIAALIWPRATTAGAISSICSGTLVTLIWEVFKINPAIDAVIPAIITSTALLIGVSLLSPKQGIEKLKPFGLS